MNQKRVSNDNITELAEKEIFVFGSNAQGRHIGGAALQAFVNFGAKEGVGEGFAGQTYAIPTMEGRESLEAAVRKFVKIATEYTEYTFLVTKVGCGIAGYDVSDIAPLFEETACLPNVYLPLDFFKYYE
jgi:hypothetical protein